MSSSIPHLPPTTNTLNVQQRSRLMRSTRKLGAVLGTTPYLLENDMSFAILPLGRNTPRTLKRHGSLFTHQQPSSCSVASSVASSAPSHHHSASVPVVPQSTPADPAPLNPPGLSTARRPGLRNRAAQLCLHLNPISVPPTDDRLAPPLSPTPGSPLPPTPITPVAPEPAEIRRKRMAKLMRHLGEKVPAELVFGADQAPKAAKSPARRRTQSADVVSPSPPAHAPTKRTEWVGEWNRANIKDVQNELRNLRVRP